ncbi:hypothetical protein [Kitasatospora sp. NPDC057223]|uniref:hypothetical protein n=1 Tax=Kitasatospora sp. NPDC057223 TaxID=3346055 RepID=UPI0036354F0C
MAGTVAVHAEPPGLGRAGTFGVVVDGVRVGHVKQGTTARFPVAAGVHTVRVTAKDRTPSNTVTVEVLESRDTRVTARGTGLGVALLIPVLAGIAVPGIYVVGFVLLTGALFRVVPGLLFRVRADSDPELRTAPDPTPATPAVLAVPAGDAAGEQHGGTGLWWESDPALAKRFGRRSAS